MGRGGGPLDPTYFEPTGGESRAFRHLYVATFGELPLPRLTGRSVLGYVTTEDAWYYCDGVVWKPFHARGDGNFVWDYLVDGYWAVFVAAGQGTEGQVFTTINGHEYRIFSDLQLAIEDNLSIMAGGDLDGRSYVIMDSQNAHIPAGSPEGGAWMFYGPKRASRWEETTGFDASYPSVGLTSDDSLENLYFENLGVTINGTGVLNPTVICRSCHLSGWNIIGAPTVVVTDSRIDGTITHTGFGGSFLFSECYGISAFALDRPHLVYLDRVDGMSSFQQFGDDRAGLVVRGNEHNSPSLWIDRSVIGDEGKDRPIQIGVDGHFSSSGISTVRITRNTIYHQSSASEKNAIAIGNNGGSLVTDFEIDFLEIDGNDFPMPSAKTGHHCVKLLGANAKVVRGVITRNNWDTCPNPVIATSGGGSWGDTRVALNVPRSATYDGPVEDTAAGAAPNDALYLVLAANAALTQERIFTPGAGLSAADGGSGGPYTLTGQHATLPDLLIGDPHTQYQLRSEANLAGGYGRIIGKVILASASSPSGFQPTIT